MIYKQLQINLKYSFKFVFLFHVLILTAEKQLFPRCEPLFVIWIQGIVNFNLIYICSWYTYLCVARNLPSPPSPTKECKHCRHFAVWRRRLSCVNLVDPSVVYYFSVEICQPFVHSVQIRTNRLKGNGNLFFLLGSDFCDVLPKSFRNRVSIQTQNATKYLLLDFQPEFLSFFLFFDGK